MPMDLIVCLAPRAGVVNLPLNLREYARFLHNCTSVRSVHRSLRKCGLRFKFYISFSNEKCAGENKVRPVDEEAERKMGGK